MLCRSSHCFLSCSHSRRTLSGTESESRNVTKYVQPSCRQCGRFRWYMRTARRSSNGTKHVGRSRTEFIPFLDSFLFCFPQPSRVPRSGERFLNGMNSSLPFLGARTERNEFRSTENRSGGPG